MTVFDLLKPT